MEENEKIPASDAKCFLVRYLDRNMKYPTYCVCRNDEAFKDFISNLYLLHGELVSVVQVDFH